MTLCGAAVWIATELAPIKGKCESADEVERSIHFAIQLPESGAEYEYYSSIWRTEISFAVSEGDFLKWASVRGYHVQPLTAGNPVVPAFSSLVTDDSIIDCGWQFSSHHGGTLYQIVYSTDRKRAYIVYAIH